MPFAIIDGSSGNVDISVNSNSYKCQINYWTADINREFFDKTTFCSSGWKEEVPGMKQLTGSAQGFLADGATNSDPSLTFSSTATVPIVLTAQTGCTFTFSGFISRSHSGIRASAMSEFALDFRSSGAVTVAWVVV